jgi:ubiquinone/menaquinone biosynthesis C-methylase UbiE
VEEKGVKLEQEILAGILPKIFGYHLLQLYIDRHLDYAVSSAIKHKIYASESPIEGCSVCCKFTELPFLPNSIDVVLLPRVLENTAAPLMVLNEVYHILIPGGNLVISGYGQFGFLGFKLWRLRGFLRSFGFKIMLLKKNGCRYAIVAKKEAMSLVASRKEIIKNRKSMVNHCPRPVSRVIENEKN